MCRPVLIWKRGVIHPSNIFCFIPAWRKHQVKSDPWKPFIRRHNIWLSIPLLFHYQLFDKIVFLLVMYTDQIVMVFSIILRYTINFCLKPIFSGIILKIIASTLVLWKSFWAVCCYKAKIALCLFDQSYKNIMPTFKIDIGCRFIFQTYLCKRIL